jgi:hypothetical protein
MHTSSFHPAAYAPGVVRHEQDAVAARRPAALVHPGKKGHADLRGGGLASQHGARDAVHFGGPRVNTALGVRQCVKPLTCDAQQRSCISARQACLKVYSYA